MVDCDAYDRVSLRLGDAVQATLNYAVRADAVAIAGFRARADVQRGAGRFFSDPRVVAVHDARPAAAQLSIDRQGIVLAQHPNGRWRFSDALDDVLDPRDAALRRDYYPELEALAKRFVVTADGRRPVHAICAATQKFTEDRARGYLGAYSRQVHADVFEVRPKLGSGNGSGSGAGVTNPAQAASTDAQLGLWDPSEEWGAMLGGAGASAGASATGKCTSSNGTSAGAEGAEVVARPVPLMHPYAAHVFGGAHSSAARHLRRGGSLPLPAGLAHWDGPERLLSARGIATEEARRMDIMLVNAWRPFDRPVRDNPLAVLDWTSVHAARDLYRLPAGVPMALGEPPQRLAYNPAHRWLYVKAMRTDEVLFFKQGDTRLPPVPRLPAEGIAPADAAAPAAASVSRFVFHTSFRLPGDPGGTQGHRSRRSLATRMLLLFKRGPTSCGRL